MAKGRKVLQRFELVTSENTYASQTAQDPRTARRLHSFIPSLAGDLVRETVQGKYPTNGIAVLESGAAITAFIEYQWYNASGTINRTWFVVCNLKLFKNTGSAWSQVSDVGTMVRVPHYAIINNLLHLWDGTTAWIFDGPNDTWVKEGFVVPLKSPAITTTAGAGSPVLVTTTRYYWTTYADETVGRLHESSSSPISVGSGVVNNSGNVAVRQRQGTVTVNTANANITGVGTDFHSGDIGMRLYANGVLAGVIATVTNATTATLTANSLTTQAGVAHVIAPVRATHWFIYASESESSKVGRRLAKVAVTTMSYTDTSPFLGVAGSLFAAQTRPVRNDPPPASTLMEVHKSRIFARRDAKPNQFFFSAGAEVSALDNGAAEESYCGTDEVNTQSDVLNEYPFPVTAAGIRALRKHGDAMYVGSNTDIFPLYGDDIDDFGFTENVALRVGVAGRFAIASTPHGLAFVSYDRKVYLLPALGIPSGDVTSALTEIGRPKRNTFEAIKATDLDNVRLVYYNFGRRDWLVLAYQDSSSVYHTWVYDFEVRGWFELQRGFAALGVFETSAGVRVLLGGGTDGFVYVIDDVTGTYVGSGNHPVATYRPALIDFGDPTRPHILRYIEYELSNETLQNNLTLKVWLDPKDVDSPGTGITLSPVKLLVGANRYRAFVTDGGAVCQRALVEVKLSASTNAGSVRGMALAAEPLSALASG